MTTTSTASEASTDYEFTADWFTRYATTWRKLLRKHNPSRFLEIGSYEGRSACFLVDEVAALRPIEIYCIDTWAGGVGHGDTVMSEVEQRFEHNVQLARSRSKHSATIYKHKAHSADALARLIAQGNSEVFDFIYVDGSHQAPDVLTDCVMAFRLLKVGGVMVLDDYLWIVNAAGDLAPLGAEEFYNLPKPAIDAFMNIFQRKMRVLHQFPLYQLYALKTGR
jgi:predicted O-methyltransferase YrrM